MTRILVVEDEPGIALGLEDDLKMEGYEVEVLSDGIAASRRAREIGSAAVIPKSGLDDLHFSAIVRCQDGLVKLLEPERLDFQFRGRRRRFLAQRPGRQVGGFHSRNLIPSQIPR